MVVVDRVETPPATVRRAGFDPLHVIAALAAALAIWASVKPLDDFDSFFHIQLGGQILHQHQLTGQSAWWLAVDPPSGWVTSQWLAEVIMNVVVTDFGWHALLALQVLTTLAVAASLAATLLVGRPMPVALPIFLLALSNVAGALLLRPQTAGLFFLVWLGAGCVRLWTSGRRPPVVLIALATLVWAQLHGTWILAPVAFLLVAVGVQLDAGRRPAPQLRATLICLLASLAGVLNPQGLMSFVLPLRFDRASSTITEWLPTTISSGFTLVWAVVVLITVVVWARSGEPVPRVEVLWVLSWTAFGMLSYRNVTPALLMTAPVAVLALTRWYDQRRVRNPSPDQSNQPAPGEAAPVVGSRRRESLVLGLFAAVLVVGATIGALSRIPRVDTFADVPGARIAAWVAEQPGPVRVFNDWNASGALIGLSDGKARLVIDNRMDLWGDDYATRIMKTETMAPGWERTLADFHPDAVVTARSSALISGLTKDGWRLALTDRDLVLLLPVPDTP